MTATALVLGLAATFAGQPPADLVPPAAVAPSPPVASGCPRYYFLLFAGESCPYRLRNGHTWATYVKATPTAGGGTVVEPVTISWLPADGDVRPLALKPYAGRAWGLDETIRHYLCMPGRVVLWGPAEIDACRYERAAAMVRRLESGAVGFRSLDSITRRKDVMHCVHAVTYADPVLESRIQPLLRPGSPGTERLSHMYLRAGGLVNPACSHDWLLPALGLDKYPQIVRRSFVD